MDARDAFPSQSDRPSQPSSIPVLHEITGKLDEPKKARRKRAKPLAVVEIRATGKRYYPFPAGAWVRRAWQASK